MRFLKDAFLWLGIAGALALNAVALSIGVWHLYRYVIAPEIGLLSDEERWTEHFRVSTSAFRRLEEKSQSLAILSELGDYAATLSETARTTQAERLNDLVLNPELPLDLRYQAARVQALLVPTPPRPAPAPTTPETSVATAVEQPGQTDSATGPGARLRTLAGVVASELASTSPERTRLLISAFRSDPCNDELGSLIADLVGRDGLPLVERSFLHGMLNQEKELCS